MGKKKISNIIIKNAQIFLVVLFVLASFSISSCQSIQSSNLFKDNLELMEEMEQNKNWNEDERAKRAISTGAPTLIVTNVEGTCGDKVVVLAGLVNNPGILGMSLTISYDESKLKLIRAETGAALNAGVSMSHSKELKSGCSFMWNGEKLSKNQIKDGTILKLLFAVNQDAEVGKTPIVLVKEKDGIYDNNLELIDLTIDNGYLTIIN